MRRRMTRLALARVVASAHAKVAKAKSFERGENQGREPNFFGGRGIEEPRKDKILFYLTASMEPLPPLPRDLIGGPSFGLDDRVLSHLLNLENPGCLDIS